MQRECEEVMSLVCTLLECLTNFSLIPTLLVMKIALFFKFFFHNL